MANAAGGVLGNCGLSVDANGQSTYKLCLPSPVWKTSPEPIIPRDIHPRNAGLNRMRNSASVET